MPEAMVGISAFYHDSAAALLVGGEIVAAAQQERVSRKKHDHTAGNSINHSRKNCRLLIDD